MKTQSPELDLRWDRMELAADAGLAFAAKAKARGGLTGLEARELQMMILDQDQRRREWARESNAQGRRVFLLEGSDFDLRTGIRVTNHGSGRPSVSVYGEIGAQFGGTTADDLRRALLEVSTIEPIDLRIHSDGGDFGEGVAMHSLIAARSGDTFGFVDGRACSAATFPLMACRSITMSVGSRMMIHQASGSLANGEADDFARAAQMLQETNDAIAAIYLPRWNGSRASLVAALEAELWLTPEQAIDCGLADSIGGDIAIAASVSSRRQYKNIPAGLSIAARLEDCPMLLAYQLALHRCAIVH